MANPVAVVDAILFDMDGTLIDSTLGVLNAWARFSIDYNLGNHMAVVHETHGRRLYDTLKEYCKITDEDKIQSEIDRFEELVLEGGLVALPGAMALTEQLERVAPSRWTIVTSASNKYAPRAIQAAGLPKPTVGIITSNDVQCGKPHPEPYLAGAQKCGVDPAKCLVVEDAISGLKSGKAAGATTLGVCTSTERRLLVASDANPDVVVEDLTRLSVQLVDGRLEISVSD
ncbi:hypothetical protein APHAL10511_006185 [Amanita phalloides]|nr:hypothetical protein APHAL10511_006185 [Amanita phalloides]